MSDNVMATPNPSARSSIYIDLLQLAQKVSAYLSNLPKDQSESTAPPQNLETLSEKDLLSYAIKHLERIETLVDDPTQTNFILIHYQKLDPIFRNIRHLLSCPHIPEEYLNSIHKLMKWWRRIPKKLLAPRFKSIRKQAQKQSTGILKDSDLFYAESLFRQNQYEEALAHFLSGLEDLDFFKTLDPSCHLHTELTLAYYVALSYLRLDKTDEAKAIFQEHIAKKFQYAQGISFLLTLSSLFEQLAQQDFKNGNLFCAIRTLRQGIWWETHRLNEIQHPTVLDPGFDKAIFSLHSSTQLRDLKTTLLQYYQAGGIQSLGEELKELPDFTSLVTNSHVSSKDPQVLIFELMDKEGARLLSTQLHQKGIPVPQKDITGKGIWFFLKCDEDLDFDQVTKAFTETLQAWRPVLRCRKRAEDRKKLVQTSQSSIQKKKKSNEWPSHETPPVSPLSITAVANNEPEPPASAAAISPNEASLGYAPSTTASIASESTEPMAQNVLAIRDITHESHGACTETIDAISLASAPNLVAQSPTVLEEEITASQTEESQKDQNLPEIPPCAHFGMWTGLLAPQAWENICDRGSAVKKRFMTIWGSGHIRKYKDGFKPCAQEVNDHYFFKVKDVEDNIRVYGRKDGSTIWFEKVVEPKHKR